MYRLPWTSSLIHTSHPMTGDTILTYLHACMLRRYGSGDLLEVVLYWWFFTKFVLHEKYVNVFTVFPIHIPLFACVMQILLAGSQGDCYGNAWRSVPKAEHIIWYFAWTNHPNLHALDHSQHKTIHCTPLLYKQEQLFAFWSQQRPSRAASWPGGRRAGSIVFALPPISTSVSELRSRGRELPNPVAVGRWARRVLAYSHTMKKSLNCVGQFGSLTSCWSVSVLFSKVMNSAKGKVTVSLLLEATELLTIFSVVAEWN